MSMKVPFVLALLSACVVFEGAWAQEIRMTRQADGTRMLINHSGKASSARVTTTKAKPPSAQRASVRPLRRLPRVIDLRSNPPYGTLINYWARKHGVDPRLITAVIQVESDFRVRARSHKGAQGLMQLMPATAQELGVEDVWDPAQNIEGGTRYLKQMLDRFGNLELAVASYNAGPTAVARYGRVPPYEETTRYVEKVLSLYSGRGYSINDSGAQETETGSDEESDTDSGSGSSTDESDSGLPKLDVGGDGDGDGDEIPPAPDFPTTCEAAAAVKTSVGCTFYPLAVPQSFSGNGGTTSFVVSNVSDQNATVTLGDRNGQLDQKLVAPGQIATFWTWARTASPPIRACSNRGAVIESDQVLQVFQFSPPYATVTADASLVFPDVALGHKHRVAVNNDLDTIGNMYVAVSATQDDTEVTFTLTAPATITLAGGQVPSLDSTQGADTYQITLDYLDVLVIAANNDNPDTMMPTNQLTGSLVESDKPVAVYDRQYPDLRAPGRPGFLLLRRSDLRHGPTHDRLRSPLRRGEVLAPKGREGRVALHRQRGRHPDHALRRDRRGDRARRGGVRRPPRRRSILGRGQQGLRHGPLHDRVRVRAVGKGRDGRRSLRLQSDRHAGGSGDRLGDPDRQLAQPLPVPGRPDHLGDMV